MSALHCFNGEVLGNKTHSVMFYLPRKNQSVKYMIKYNIFKNEDTLSLNSPLKANWFSGFPSGTLYLLNQSSVASRYPGLSRLTSSISAESIDKGDPWILAYIDMQLVMIWGRVQRLSSLLLLNSPAWGSSVLITMTFQSVSPSSIRARVPSTLTLIISPREHTWEMRVNFWKSCKQLN